MADPDEGPGGSAPLIFRTKLRPEGPKKNFLETGPPTYLRVWATAPGGQAPAPFIAGSGSGTERGYVTGNLQIYVHSV